MKRSDNPIIRKAVYDFYLERCKEDGVEPLSEGEMYAEMDRHDQWLKEH